MSYKPEVYVQDEWSANGCAFETKEEAEAAAFDIMNRWILVQDYRAVESDQPVNFRFKAGELTAI